MIVKVDDKGNKEILADISVQSDWSVTDSNNRAFIKNKPAIVGDTQSNWIESDPTSPAHILNKPTIPAPQIQSDWNQTNNQALDFIKNKPPPGAIQVQSDWEQEDVNSPDYIKNKPDIPAHIAEFVNDYSRMAAAAVVNSHASWLGTAVILRFGNICVFMHSRNITGATFQPLGAVPVGFRPDVANTIFGTIANQSGGGTFTVTFAARAEGTNTPSTMTHTSVVGMVNQTNTVNFFTMWVCNEPFPEIHLLGMQSNPMSQI